MSAPTNNSNSGGQDQLGLGALLQSVGQQLRQEVEARVAGARASVQESVQAIKEDAFKPSPLITEEHKHQFANDGFVVVRDAVPEHLRRLALREINRSLGQPLPSDNPLSKVPKVLTRCPELTATPVIVDLLRKSEALGCAHALIGDGTSRAHFGQIALRFPGDLCVPQKAMGALGPVAGQLAAQWLGSRRAGPDAQYANPVAEAGYTTVPSWETRWHIDGWPGLFNQTGKVENFTMLVGILLSDAVDPLSGNLTVYPGSHLHIEKVLRDAGGPEAVFAPVTTPGGGGGSGDPQAESVRLLRERVAPMMGRPVQVSARAGDVVLAHYQLAHTIAPNVSPNIRYCVYFRLTHRRRPVKSFAPDAMNDVFLEYAGIRHLRPGGSADLPPLAAHAPFATAHQQHDQHRQQQRVVAETAAVLEAAVAADTAQQWDRAIKLYSEGVEKLLAAAAAERNHTHKTTMREKAAQYLNRAESIKLQLAPTT
eukprot:m.70558 g.70558  ORF g.70558 m.70558 type:complete len:482 (-) comp14075_c0_seq3:218-1663(-)